jgi:hypothetical protein
MMMMMRDAGSLHRRCKVRAGEFVSGIASSGQA